MFICLCTVDLFVSLDCRGQQASSSVFAAVFAESLLLCFFSYPGGRPSDEHVGPVQTHH